MIKCLTFDANFFFYKVVSRLCESQHANTWNVTIYGIIDFVGEKKTQTFLTVFLLIWFLVIDAAFCCIVSRTIKAERLHLSELRKRVAFMHERSVCGIDINLPMHRGVKARQMTNSPLGRSNERMKACSTNKRKRYKL